MKFWHKLLLLIATIAVMLIASVSYIEIQAAYETAQQVETIGKEVLSAQAESFLSKIINDQAGKTALKLDLVKKTTQYAAEALAGFPEASADERQVAELLSGIMSSADNYLRQIFYSRSDGQLILGNLQSDSNRSRRDISDSLHVLVPELISKGTGTFWHEIPVSGRSLRLDIYAISFTPVVSVDMPSSLLGALVSFADLIDEFNQDQPIKGSYTFLINEQGHLLAAPPNARIDLSPTPEYTSNGFYDLPRSTKAALKIALVNAALGQSAIERVPIRDQIKFITYRPIAGTDLRLCLVSPVSLATAESNRLSQFIIDSSHQLRIKIVTTSLVLLLAAIAVAALLSRKLTKPLMEMEQATQRIANGDLDHIVVAKGTDEIGTLAQSFNSMTRALKDTMRQLSASKDDISNQLHMTTTLLETIPAPVYYRDSNGCFMGCNSAFEAFFGKSRSEIIGKFHFYDNPEELVPFDYQQDLDLIMSSGAQHYELQVPDGQGADRHLIINKAAITGSDTERSGMICVLTDITDRILAEKALRQYARIVSATSDLMSFIDRNYVYTAVNDAYLKAHLRNEYEIVGRTIPELMGPAVFEEKIRGPIDECLSGRTVSYQAWFNFSGAGRRFMDVTYYPYYESDSNITGIVVNSRDITRTSQLETQLRQASKMESIGTLAGGIAHDFNNILSPIIGFAELLLDDIPDNQPAYTFLEQILQASMRARDLVKQILIFSRQADHEIKPIRVESVLKEVLKLARSTLPSTIEIKQRLNCRNTTIMADPTEIHQMLMNLITNAFHAMETTGGQLSVGLEERMLSVDDLKDLSMTPGAYLCLSVEDTGHGMDGEILEKIFDPYFTTKAVDKGTGLGLAVSHGVVKRYGGSISVYSEVGKGTVFNVYLPVTAQEEERVAIKSVAELEGGNEHILVVDDEIMIAKLVATTLKKSGYYVTKCTDSIEALQIYQKDPQAIDLVISDLTMPYMTGVELINSIKQISKKAKVILCTGFSDQMDNQKAKRIGVNAFIMKPVVRSELIEAVRKVLDEG